VTQDHPVVRPARLGMPAIKAMRGRRGRLDILGSAQPVLRGRLDKLGHLGLARRVRPAMLASRVMLEPRVRLVQRDLQVVPPAPQAQRALRATMARRDQLVRQVSRGQAAARLDLPAQPAPVLRGQPASPARRVLSARWGLKVQLGKPAPLAFRVMMDQQVLLDIRALSDQPGPGQLARRALTARLAQLVIPARQGRMVPLALPDRRAP
jgi:hypothetical protein